MLIGVIVYACIIRASWANFINAIKIGEAEIAGSLRITTVPGRFIIIPLPVRTRRTPGQSFSISPYLPP